MTFDPWLGIPLADYEGHMTAVGQAAALRQLFLEVYARVRPRRLAVLGCTAGADFEVMDQDITDTAVGVDVNPEYLAVARRRLAHLGRPVTLVCGDVLEVGLPQGPFDLVHAALLIEYVDLTRLVQRLRGWLVPGGRVSIVSQEPVPGVAAVSATGYDSLRSLSDRMSLRPATEIEQAALGVGLALEARRTLELPNGKALTHSVFRIDGARSRADDREGVGESTMPRTSDRDSSLAVVAPATNRSTKVRSRSLR
jgi:SAM-dependent methyltransferase